MSYSVMRYLKRPIQTYLKKCFDLIEVSKNEEYKIFILFNLPDLQTKYIIFWKQITCLAKKLQSWWIPSDPDS